MFGAPRRSGGAPLDPACSGAPSGPPKTPRCSAHPGGAVARLWIPRVRGRPERAPEDPSSTSRSRPPPLLPLVERLRPVGMEQPRERAVGEHPAAGLAARAVVGLVLGVD